MTTSRFFVAAPVRAWTRSEFGHRLTAAATISKPATSRSRAREGVARLQHPTTA